MQLVIAEKPSVAANIAAALGVKEKKDGYIEGGGYLISWCVGHLVELAEAAAYGEQFKKWSYETLPILPEEWQYTVAADKGDALLQKTYTADFLSKTIKKNHGEIPQYYIQNSHPAIIDPDTFELVQNEIKRRSPERHHLHKNSPLTARIICGECGACYGRKVWHSGTKYRSYIWRCNRKYDGDVPCDTPNLREEEIEAAFVTAFNQLLGNKARYIAHFEELLPLLADTSNLDAQLDTLQAQHEELKNSANINPKVPVGENITYRFHYGMYKKNKFGKF